MLEFIATGRVGYIVEKNILYYITNDGNLYKSDEDEPKLLATAVADIRVRDKDLIILTCEGRVNVKGIPSRVAKIETTNTACYAVTEDGELYVAVIGDWFCHYPMKEKIKEVITFSPHALALSVMGQVYINIMEEFTAILPLVIVNKVTMVDCDSPLFLDNDGKVWNINYTPVLATAKFKDVKGNYAVDVNGDLHIRQDSYYRPSRCEKKVKKLYTSVFLDEKGRLYSYQGKRIMTGVVKVEEGKDGVIITTTDNKSYIYVYGCDAPMQISLL